MGAGLAALGFALGGMALGRGALAPVAERVHALRASVRVESSIPDLVGVAGWAVVLAGLAVLGALLWRLPLPAATSGPWPWPLTGVALGLLGVLAWVAGGRAGWLWGLSMTGPSRSLLEAFILGSPGALNWGALMLVGVPVGSWASARLRGPVAWQAPAPPELPRRFLGGLLMGAGGTLAGGCNIGNALTGLSILATQSLIATAAIGAGGALGVVALRGAGRSGARAGRPSVAPDPPTGRPPE